MMTLCIEGVTMTTKQLIISSFTQFKELKNARKTPFAKSVLYLLVLSIIMALPISYQVFQVLENIKQDGQKIATKIPDFSIKTGKLMQQIMKVSSIKQILSSLLLIRKANDLKKILLLT